MIAINNASILHANGNGNGDDKEKGQVNGNGDNVSEAFGKDSDNRPTKNVFKINFVRNMCHTYSLRLITSPNQNGTLGLGHDEKVLVLVLLQLQYSPQSHLKCGRHQFEWDIVKKFKKCFLSDYG